MRLSQINKEDFEIYHCEDEITEFYFDGTNCKLKMSDLDEIRMSIYVYFDVKLFKENRLLASGEMQLTEKYYSPISPNKKFVYIPFRGGTELINMVNEEKFESSINWFCGNIYNKSSTKMIINGTNEYKIIDLEKMREFIHVREGKEFNNDVFFSSDSSTWQIKGNNKIEEFNFETNEKKVFSIESPFEKFGIDINEYKSLIEKNTHCLWLPKGGMAHSSNLNSWNYCNVKDRTIFKTLIPISEIKYSNGYKTDYCEVESKYVEIK